MALPYIDLFLPRLLLGAGQYSDRHHIRYKKLCREACLEGMMKLKNEGSAIDAAVAAVKVLEDDPLTNAGFGSNLTLEGLVESDASVMNGDTLRFGACGAVQQVKNPIVLAYDVCQKQSMPLPLGLMPPMLIVGEGALNHARIVGIKTVADEYLISDRALYQYRKYRNIFNKTHTTEDLYKVTHLDTVGAVCIDSTGQVAAACSSGGLVLKRPGRVGQAAIYGSGVWADSFDRHSDASVAVCTTGCGEHLVQTRLAQVIAEDLVKSTCPTTGLCKCMTDKFINSRYLNNVERKMGGALVLRRDNKNGEVSLLWGHSTEGMSVGFMKKGDKSAMSTVSTLPSNVEPGHKVNVGGTCFYLPRKKNRTTKSEYC